MGALVLLLGLFTTLLRRVGGSEPLIAMVGGVILGPWLHVLRPEEWGGGLDSALLEVARITLTLTLVEVAIRIPRSRQLGLLRSLVVLLGLLMPAMWLVGGALAWTVMGLPVLAAALLGAILTPTDPVIASSIVNGRIAERNLPTELRYLLSAEAGANDGLALAFVSLPLLLMRLPGRSGLESWAVDTLLLHVTLAAAIGATLGLLAGRLLRWVRRAENVQAPGLMAYTLLVGLLVLGAADLLHSNGVLAVFVAGVALDWQIDAQPAEKRRTEQIVTRFFTVPVFVVFGAALPLHGWLALGWRGLAFTAGILLLRRLPALWALSPLVSRLQQREATLFFGWFGPMGVASIYYAGLAWQRTGMREIWVLASLVVATSILAHGLSATALTRRYGRVTGFALRDEEETPEAPGPGTTADGTPSGPSTNNGE